MRNGPGIIEMLRVTGFRTHAELVRETTPLQRRKLAKMLEAWHDRRSEAQRQGGGGMGPPGL